MPLSLCFGWRLALPAETTEQEPTHLIAYVFLAQRILTFCNLFDGAIDPDLDQCSRILRGTEKLVNLCRGRLRVVQRGLERLQCTYHAIDPTVDRIPVTERDVPVHGGVAKGKARRVLEAT